MTSFFNVYVGLHVNFSCERRRSVAALVGQVLQNMCKDR